MRNARHVLRVAERMQRQPLQPMTQQLGCIWMQRGIPDDRRPRCRPGYSLIRPSSSRMQTRTASTDNHQQNIVMRLNCASSSYDADNVNKAQSWTASLSCVHPHVKTKTQGGPRTAKRSTHVRRTAAVDSRIRQCTLDYECCKALQHTPLRIRCQKVNT